jgi:predicted transcriptional regulator
MLRHALLLSIRPKFAERILDGRKSVELRRVRPLVPEGAVLLIYVSSPVKALRAISTVQCVTSAQPDELWRSVRDKVGLTRTEFDNYFSGAEEAFAIHLGRIHRLSPPFGLAELRKLWPNLSPPQVYRYFTEHEFASLLPALRDRNGNDIVTLQWCQVASESTENVLSKPSSTHQPESDRANCGEASQRARDQGPQG